MGRFGLIAFPSLGFPLALHYTTPTPSPRRAVGRGLAVIGANLRLFDSKCVQRKHAFTGEFETFMSGKQGKNTLKLALMGLAVGGCTELTYTPTAASRPHDPQAVPRLNTTALPPDPGQPHAGMTGLEDADSSLAPRLDSRLRGNDGVGRCGLIAYPSLGFPPSRE